MKKIRFTENQYENLVLTETNMKRDFEQTLIGLNEDEQKSFVENCISEAINTFIAETARIQPYKGKVKGQEDYSDEAYVERAGLDKANHDTLKAMKKKYPDAKISVGKNPDYFDYNVKHNRYEHPLPQGQKEIDKLQKELTKKQREKTKADRYNLDDLGYHDVDPNFQYDVDAVNYKSIQKAVSGSKASGIENTQLGEVDNSVRGKVFSYGNKKLPANTMIFNLTTAKNCPSRMCQVAKQCYAKKGENRFIEVFLRNLRNKIMLEHISLKDFLKLLELYIEYAPMKIKNIRLSEEGDFLSLNEVKIADAIAAHIKAKYGIQTTIYTAKPYDFAPFKNLIVNASIPQTKNPTRYFFAKEEKVLRELGINFKGKGIQYNDKVGHYFVCPCECRLCGFCYRTKEENGEPDIPITVFEKLR